MEATHLPILTLAESITKIEAGKFIFTHYSDQDIAQLNEILATLPQNLNRRVFLADDGQSFQI